MQDNNIDPMVSAILTPAEEDQLKRNLDGVLERLERARAQAGRKPEDVQLVAVSKWHGLPSIVAVARHWNSLGGSPVFSENYIQEALAKQAGLADMGGDAPKLRWHFTGHLQSKKAKQAVGCFDLIHTLDSLSLAQNLQTVLQKGTGGVKNSQAPLLQPVLVQVNIGEEDSKSGMAPEDLKNFLIELQGFGGIKVKGLMILPPFSENPEDTRPYFVQLRQMRDRLEQELGIGLPHLSMGMSHDFEAAVEEGATLVRVGTDIFGQRQY